MSDSEGDINDVAHEVYTDTKRGYWGKTKMLQKYSKVLDKMKSMQRHKIRSHRVKRKLYRFEEASKPFDSVQIDLAFLPRLKSSKNNNIKGFIVVIDVFTRYLFYRTFTSRKNLHEPLEAVIKQMKSEYNKTPLNMTGDNEFATTKMQVLAAKYDFKWWFGDAHEKYRTGICERVIRTIKNLIKRYLVENDTTKYVDVLPDLVYNYNHTIHRTINTTPSDAMTTGKVNDKRKANVIPQFEVGDKVRVEKRRNAFTKGDVPYFSDEIYEIIGRDRLRYIVKNVKTDKKKRKLYAVHQLLKVEGDVKEGSNYETEVKENVRVARHQSVLKREGLNLDDIIDKKERRQAKRDAGMLSSSDTDSDAYAFSSESSSESESEQVVRRSGRERRQPDRYKPADNRPALKASSKQKSIAVKNKPKPIVVKPKPVAVKSKPVAVKPKPKPIVVKPKPKPKAVIAKQVARRSRLQKKLLGKPMPLRRSTRVRRGPDRYKPQDNRK